MVVMNYDKYKLSNPQDDGFTSDEVTSCCGVDEEGSRASNCCDSQFFAETDICNSCKEHAEEYMRCSECEEDDSQYTIISEYEYNERRREDAQEHNRDED